jgi:hypothetical protein
LGVIGAARDGTGMVALVAVLSVMVVLVVAMVLGKGLISWIFADSDDEPSPDGGAPRMDKSNRVAQVYGYVVCLVAVVTVLALTSSVINDMFAIANPLESTVSGAFFGNEPNTSLTSFEAWRATQPRAPRASSVATTQVPTPDSVPVVPGVPRRMVVHTPDTLSDAQQHARFDVLRADRISQVRYRSTQSLVSEGLVLILAIVLFIAHWRWLQRLGRSGDAKTVLPA